MCVALSPGTANGPRGLDLGMKRLRASVFMFVTDISVSKSTLAVTGHHRQPASIIFYTSLVKQVNRNALQNGSGVLSWVFIANN